MKPLLLMLFAFFAVAPTAGAQVRTLPGNAHLLLNVTFLEINLERATLTEAIDLLREASREVDEDGGGINIVIPPDTEENTRPITVSLRNISGPDFFRLILDMTNTRLEPRGNLLWIVPRG
ncbi:MAG: hypothetical protein JJU05_18280 [Verrucomicrobia bacterium]|nr:hypothetical protein [Verrucomicrobiota bacterium]MCH8528566.1 hypothetical protein [Kiritimatiellia bacterium]